MGGGNIQAALAEKGFVVCTAEGGSMLPLIRPGRDTLLLKRPEGPIPRYAIALYRSAAGRLILHRVIGRDAAGYVFWGDHCVEREYGVAASDVLAVLAELWRDGRRVNLRALRYRAYVRVWCASRFTRRALLYLLRRVHRVKVLVTRR